MLNCCISSISPLNLVDDRHKGEDGVVIVLSLTLKFSAIFLTLGNVELLEN